MPPWETVFLADLKDDVVAGNDDGVDDLGALLAVALEPAQHVELHAGQLAVLDDEALRRMVFDDVDLLFLGVFELPR